MTKNFLSFLEKNNLQTSVDTSFKKCSVMLDVARGRVLKVDYLKDLIKKLSFFGVNEVWLYVEDLLDISDSFFGYFRGKYSLKELQELDKYAKGIGVEMVFSIQTLGHFEQYLHWQKAYDLRDTSDILLANSPKTYELIQKILEFCKSAFASTRIHIGLDETFSLGKGAYIHHFGYTEPSEIYFHHLQKVKELANQVGYQDILLWSDMVISHCTENEGYYVVKKLIPEKVYDCKGLGLVYWDYYNDNISKIENNLSFHQQICDKLIYATGVWTFQRPVVDIELSRKTITSSVMACKQKNIDEICITAWNDNGGYCDPDDILVMMPFIANKVYQVDLNSLNFLYNSLTSKNIETELAKTVINELDLSAIATIYDDLIYGIYLNKYFYFKRDTFDKAINKLNSFNLNNYKKDPYFYNLFMIIKLKLEIRYFFLSNLASSDALLHLIPKLKKLYRTYEFYLSYFEKRWEMTSKENGIEIHQLRISTLLKRINHFIKLIKQKIDFSTIIEKTNEDYDVDNRFSSIFSPTIFPV